MCILIAVIRGCSSVDRVSASEAEGRGFDPRQPRHSSDYEEVITNF
jgi:hypothetical protein